MKRKITAKSIAVLCSGLDARKDRGYENSSRNLFRNLNSDNSSDYYATLYKGSGLKKHNEFVINSFANKRWVKMLGNRILNDTFVFEYILFTLFYIFYNWFNRSKYDTIYTQEPRVAKTLYQLRFLLVGKPRITFGMGVSMDPEHYVNIADRIHIVNIEHYDKAIKQFPEARKFSLIPNPGSDSKKYLGNETKAGLRNRFGIKTKYVLISVGAINKAIKRMDYIVDESILLSKDWTLLMVGHDQDIEITSNAKKYLGDRFIHLFVSPDKIPELYYMSDVAVLASFYEGFPNVVLEASQNKIAPILHDCKRNRWILKTESDLLVDMSKGGSLSDLLNSKNREWFKEKGENVNRLYNDNYSWEALKANYINFLE